MINHLDKQLVDASLGGDMAAFSELVERYQDAVYNLAYRMCGNAATAEDLAQESFIRAWRKLNQYKPAYSFRNWVLGICANLSRSRYRRWSRRQKMQEAYKIEMTIDYEKKSGDNPHTAERLENLESGLTALPETLRVVVVLKYMEDMSLQEISETLKIKLSAVKMRLARAREQLARRLSQINQENHYEP